ncbi:MAG: hypothetical protein RBR09_08000 [Desulfobulbaceae bacterium]|nr:hypothetical protein [Desulfobulbaceae bacterium]MDY0351180.1 hypothetical protein [Desulfobulbaceae bacterium]
MNLKFFADMENVAFDRMHADEKFGSDLFVGGAGGKMDQDFPLSPGQLRACLFLWSERPGFLADIFHQDAPRYPHFTEFQGADPFEQDIRLIVLEKKAFDSEVDVIAYVGIALRQVEKGDDIMLQVRGGFGPQHRRDGFPWHAGTIDEDQPPVPPFHAAGMGDIFQAFHQACLRRFVGLYVANQEFGGELGRSDYQYGTVLYRAFRAIKPPAENEGPFWSSHNDNE